MIHWLLHFLWNVGSFSFLTKQSAPASSVTVQEKRRLEGGNAAAECNERGTAFSWDWGISVLSQGIPRPASALRAEVGKRAAAGPRGTSLCRSGCPRRPPAATPRLRAAGSPVWAGSQRAPPGCTHACALVQTDQMEAPRGSVTGVNRYVAWPHVFAFSQYQSVLRDRMQSALPAPKYSRPLLVRVFPSFLALVEIWEAWSNSAGRAGIGVLLISLIFGWLRIASKLLVVPDVQTSFLNSPSTVQSVESECQG